MLLFLISALRAIVEMLGLSLIGLALMAVFAGNRRDSNPIYRLFALITRAPRRLAGSLLPGRERPVLAGVLCFVLLFLLWIGLALWRTALV
ncbi:hypothetical protein [Azonexus hydrophilus]|nr:hypothetical protein [Azonexus hydrophilus]